MRLTRPLERLLTVLLSDAASPRYGYDLMKSAQLTSGTLYPMLARLEEQGMLTSGWEQQPAQAGRPPRRYYRLTGEGELAAGRLLARHRQSGAGRPVRQARPAAGGAS